MKVLLLAGGYGTRLSEETDVRPKPMVEIGDKPILWHIMKLYSHFGFNEFIILLGYKGYYIKEYFANYFLHQNNVTIDLGTNDMEVHSNLSEPWKVTLLDTGVDVMTGGRIKRAQSIVGNEPFMLTYGDGVSDLNIKRLIEYHKSHNGLITMTSVQPEGRFGAIEIEEDYEVSSFWEKPKSDTHWINAGYFVCEHGVFDYIDRDSTVFEQEPLRNLSKEGKLYAFKHNGFWKPMDTIKDKKDLNKAWNDNKAQWKVWKNNV